MATGLDIAAGAAGFASLGVLLLQGCIKGFILLSTAQNFGRDADIVRSEIEYEQYRLFKWAEKVGLTQGGTPIQNMNWEIVHGHLKRLEILLSDTSKFKSSYRLELVTTEEKLSVDDISTGAPKKGFRRFFAPEFHHETAKTLHNGVSVWRRLKWAAIDKEGVGLLIGDIKRFVDDLWALLQCDDLAFIRSGMEALLRHAISQTKESNELSQVELFLRSERDTPSKFEDGAVRSALFLKQQSLLFGFDDDRQSTKSTIFSPQPVSKTLSGVTLVPRIVSDDRPKVCYTKKSKALRGSLSYKLLKLRAPPHQHAGLREIATYDKKAVLVEWKVVETENERQLKHRIKTLATLLQDIDSSSFHSLKCLGYLKDPKSENYGYIFQMPDESSKFSTLNYLLDDHAMAPSLDDRFVLAIALVETVLQLHTAGWLHKGLRSDNVILFYQKDRQNCDIARVFLEGYEYARADNPSDMTEAPRHQQEANLYRHPKLLQAKRASFRKAYDLYGLGCVLLEIGLRETLTTTLLHFDRKEKGRGASQMSRLMPVTLRYESEEETDEINKARVGLLEAKGPGSIEETLKFTTGEIFASIVWTCLSVGDENNSASNASDEEDFEDGDDDDKCIDLELEILQRLRKLKG